MLCITYFIKTKYIVASFNTIFRNIISLLTYFLYLSEGYTTKQYQLRKLFSVK